MFSQFRTHYPQGSLVSELVAIESGQYVVRAIASVDGTMLATSLAAAHTIEQAEDRARSRLLELLELGESSSFSPAATTTVAPSPSPSASLSAGTSPVEAAIPVPSPREEHGVSPSSNAASGGLETHDRVENGVAAREPVAMTEESPEVNLPLQTPESLSPPAPEVEKKTRASRKGKKPPAESEAMQESVEPSLEEEEIVLSVPEPQPEPIAPSIPETQSEFPGNGLDLDTSPMDFSDIIAQTNLELKRLGWTNEQGRQYLLETYGKRSRQLLNDRELLEFLEYLKSQPVPSN